MFKKFKRPAVWSNFFYAAPLTAALARGIWFTAAAVGALLIFSLAFHYSGERKFIRSDILAASIVALFSLALLFSGGWQSGYAVIAASLIIIGLYIRFWLEQGNRGGTLHALWHMVAAVLILACIFSYPL